MNTKVNRSFFILTIVIGLIFSSVAPAYAVSPWMEKKTYGEKTGGKLTFGLKNSLLGWMTPWAEARSPKYSKQWVGFSAGIGKGVINMAGGLIQLATFFIPVDFPDIGQGLPIPDPEKAKNPPKSYAPYTKKPNSFF